MSRVSIRLLVVSTVILVGVLGGVAGPVAAGDVCNEDCDGKERTVPVAFQEIREIPHPVDADRAGIDEDTGTAVTSEFVRAKKAFHEARQEIQAIKKGDESPVEDVPTFFDSEDDSTEDDDLQEDEPSIQK